MICIDMREVVRAVERGCIFMKKVVVVVVLLIHTHALAINEEAPQ